MADIMDRDDYPLATIEKTDDGYTWHSGQKLWKIQTFDQDGAFRSQIEMNPRDGSPIYMRPEREPDGTRWIDGVRVEDLSEEEMDEAIMPCPAF